jgi:hypothetical protein
MKKPISDTEITSSMPEILRYLDKQHYKSADWSADAGIKQRGLGIRETDMASETACTRSTQFQDLKGKGKYAPTR